MKTYLLLVMLCATAMMTSSDANAQKGKLPPFRMQTSSGKIFKAEQLPMGKPIILIYFDPGCDHYGITSMPFVALYSSMGDLVKEYRINPSLPDLKIQLNKTN